MPLNEDNDLDYWGNDNPKCPHCDRDIDIAEHELYQLYDENSQDIECPYCEKEFHVVPTPTCTWRFSTDEQESA